VKTIGELAFKFLIASTILWSVPTTLFAWEPNANDLDAAIKTGDFTGFRGQIPK